MKNLNEIIGENLTFLRKKAGFTQLELGEKFNYSDKTVSKWEQGSVLPSVDVLKEIADFYGVSVDYILNEHSTESEFKSIVKQTPNFTKKTVLVSLIISFIFAIGLVIYFAQVWNLKTADYHINRWWVTFLWCIPLSFFVLYIAAKAVYHHQLTATIFSSLIIWSLLAAAYVTWYPAAKDNGGYWYLFFIGVPLQVAIVLVYNLRK